MSLPASTTPGLESIPAWERYGWLRAGFSTRLDGVSTIYSATGGGERNLGWTASDPAAAVAENRQRLMQDLLGGEGKSELVTLLQVHSARLQPVVADHKGLVTPDGKAMVEADALATNLPGITLGIQTADCVPVLLADAQKRVVAAFHAGWRGTVARIVEHGIAALETEYGLRPADIVAAIGPSIGPCCYAVGGDLVEQFRGSFAYAPELFSTAGEQLHLNLQEANRRQLIAAGVRAESITMQAECTACTRTPDGGRKYFSYRDEKGFTGRMLSVVSIVESLD